MDGKYLALRQFRRWFVLLEICSSYAEPPVLQQYRAQDHVWNVILRQCMLEDW